MNDLMDALYQFVQGKRMDRVLEMPDYDVSLRCSERQEAWLRERLDKEGQRHLDTLLNEERIRQAAEQAAVFQATVEVCRELNGLVRG